MKIIVKSHYVLLLRSELLHFPLLSFLMYDFIFLCHRSRCLITTVLLSAIYPGFLYVLRRRPTRKYRLPSRSFGHLHFTWRLGTQRNVSPRFWWELRLYILMTFMVYFIHSPSVLRDKILAWIAKIENKNHWDNFIKNFWRFAFCLRWSSSDFSSLQNLPHNDTDGLV